MIGVTVTVQLVESTGALVDPASENKSGTRWRVKVIEAGQGSSAYYPDHVLSDCASVFKAGTQIYFDHPTITEARERPERSVRDLAGTLATDGEYEDGAVYAEAEFLPWTAPVLDGLAKIAGLSMRAVGIASESNDGPVLEELIEVFSVDVVTQAGAGGKFVEVLESARPKDATEAKNSDVASALSELIKSEGSWAWVRDFDTATGTVWYETDDGVYEQKYISNSGVPTSLTGLPVKVRTAVEYVPVEESTHTVKENDMTPEQEETLNGLVESVASLVSAIEGLGTQPPAVEVTESDPLDLAKALADSELSEAGREQVVAAVKGGAELTEAIDKQKKYEESIRAAAGSAYVVEESKSAPKVVGFTKAGA